jgi:uncharacterized protein with NRDE domain
MEAHGTWMAMSKQGKISMVTNYRDPKNIDPQAPSRGQLVSDFLLNEEAPKDYLKKIESRGKAYNGFNLIVGSPDELFYYSNYQGTIEKIQTGIHGLSNQLLNTPWPKVVRGIEKMKTATSDKNIEPKKLFEVLYDNQIADDAKLPDTGIGLERERVLSSMFIKSPNYGTRCSTVVLVNRSNEVLYSERVYDLQTFDYATRSFHFNV